MKCQIRVKYSGNVKEVEVWRMIVAACVHRVPEFCLTVTHWKHRHSTVWVLGILEICLRGPRGRFVRLRRLVVVNVAACHWE